MLTREGRLGLLEATIPFILSGGVYLAPELLRKLDAGPSTVTSPGRNLLTARQRQVLEKIAHGKPNKIISHELRLSPSTVKVHIAAIMKKLGAKNRTEAALLGQQLTGQEDESSAIAA